MSGIKSIKELFRIMSFIKPGLWRYLTGLLGAGLLGAAASVCTAYVIMYLLDAALGASLPMLVRALEIICLVVAALCVFSPLLNYIFKSSVKKTMAAVRLKVFSKVEELEPAYFDSVHSGDIVSRLTNDLLLFEEAFSDQILMLVHTVLCGVSSIVFMFLFDWRTAIIMLILGVVTVLLNTLFIKPLHTLGELIQQRIGVLTERISDIAGGYAVIRLFNIKRETGNKFDKANDEVMRGSVKRVKVVAVQEGANFLLGWLNFAGILLIGSLLALFGASSFGRIAANLQLLNGVTFMFLQLGSFLSQLQGCLAGASRVFEIMDMPEEKNRGSAYKGVTDSVYIKFKNVSFNYGGQGQGLKNFSMDIERGCKAALAGPSGGGKSTVFKLLLGYYPQEEGEIIIDGKPIEEYSLTALRNMIAYVPQDTYLFDGTIYENIGLARPNASREEIIEAAKAAYAHDFISQQPDGYETMVGERGVRLSGGQKQRIAIARAILKDAPILLLDEATSALDSESELLVQKALEKLMAGRTVLTAAHRLSTIESSDVIYVVEEGSILEKGSHKELCKESGLYRKLWELQSGNNSVA